MIDTDEPTQIDYILHQTREHSPDGWRKLSKSLIEVSDDDRLLIEYAPLLLQEVKRLRDLAIEAYEIPMNTGEEKCMVKHLLREMIK